MGLRKEKYKQFSGSVNLGKIEPLKEGNYYAIDVTLDGDAPKQYIKAYFYYKNCPRKSKPKLWNGYYAKFGSKSYPHESIVEYVINQIGEAIGIKMNETKLVQANGQIRFLSKDFIKGGKRLIHGTEILAEYFEDRQFVEEVNQDRKERRKFFTFEVVEEAIRHVYDDYADSILSRLVELITFDAIIGNNDRHYYNWGVIGDTTKEKNNPVEFAPIYDSARGLLWNLNEAFIRKMHRESKTNKVVIEAYCNRSNPRFSFDDNYEPNHFEMVNFLISRSEEYKYLIGQLVSYEKEELSLQKLNSVVSTLFSVERKELMERILSYRFNKIREDL